MSIQLKIIQPTSLKKINNQQTGCNKQDNSNVNTHENVTPEEKLDLAIEANADTILGNINKALVNIPASASASASTDNEEALQKAIKEMGLRTTYCKGVYCEQHNPNMPKGNWTHQRHYVWNEATQQMIQLTDNSGNELYYISSNGSQAGNCKELIQAYQNGYNFTEEDGVYEKNGIKYIFNTETNKFEEVKNNNTADEAEQTSHTIQTVQNDDGSYRVDEYDESGILVKYAEYDADDKITYEWIHHDDESYSDKFYTYNNNELTQIQETIHYTNGNYTLIFTDGNGNLTEEQKVIHNELGGLTFDTTFGDGTRSLMVNNGNNDIISETFYAKDGKIEKINEYHYDENNHNLYTVVTKNADGQVISEENWESYRFASGGGSFILSRTEYNQDGSIAFKEEYSEVETIDNLIENNIEQCENIENKIRNLDVPTPPRTSDYILENGQTDDVAYQQAYDEYKKAIEEYDNQIKELNNQLRVANEEIDALKSRKNEITITNSLSETSEKITLLEQSSWQNEPIIQDLKAELNRLSEGMISSNTKNLQIKNEISLLYQQIDNLKIPTPPSTDDFILEDNSIDGNRYQEALEKYEQDTYQYDKTVTELNARIAVLENELRKNELEQQQNLFDFELLNNNINDLLKITSFDSTIETQIDKLTQNGKTTEANSLKQEYQELKNEYQELMLEKINIQQEIRILQEQLQNNLPTPPGVGDYTDNDGNVDDQGYSDAYKKYEYQCNLYNELSEEFNHQMDRLYAKMSEIDEEMFSILERINQLFDNN